MDYQLFERLWQATTAGIMPTQRESWLLEILTQTTALDMPTLRYSLANMPLAEREPLMLALVQTEASIPKAIAWLRRHRGEPTRLEECDKLIDAADVQLRAIIVLSLDAGMGNSDIGIRPLAAIELASG